MLGEFNFTFQILASPGFQGGRADGRPKALALSFQRVPREDENDEEILGILVLQVRSKWELVAAF